MPFICRNTSDQNNVIQKSTLETKKSTFARFRPTGTQLRSLVPYAQANNSTSLPMSYDIFADNSCRNVTVDNDGKSGLRPAGASVSIFPSPRFDYVPQMLNKHCEGPDHVYRKFRRDKWSKGSFLPQIVMMKLMKFISLLDSRVLSYIFQYRKTLMGILHITAIAKLSYQISQNKRQFKVIINMPITNAFQSHQYEELTSCQYKKQYSNAKPSTSYPRQDNHNIRRKTFDITIGYRTKYNLKHKVVLQATNHTKNEHLQTYGQR